MVMGGRTIALVGLGAIGRTVAERMAADGEGAPERLVAVLVRGAQADAARASLPAAVAVATTPEELLRLRPDAVAECAGQDAVRTLGPVILSAGIDFFVISSGALADDAVRDGLLSAARSGGARLLVPAGAIAGLDGLAALRLAGLTEVVYTSTKPPVAWKGTPADGRFDLDRIDDRTTIFEGPAREAARLFPKNANLAATVALAGLGLDRTLVRLVADPAAGGNAGRIEATSAAGSLRVEMAGPASANPKTSASTAFSLLRALRRNAAEIELPD